MKPNHKALCRLVYACLLPGLVFITGCTPFTPPRFTGELSKIATPIRLPTDPSGEYAFSENSKTNINMESNFLSLYTIYRRGEVHVSSAARSSVKPAGKGYVVAVNFNRISVRPIGPGGSEADGGFTVKDLGYTGFMDGDAHLIAFDVDKDSPGWSSLEMEHRKSIEEELAKWKKRRGREMRLPDVVVDGQQVTVDASLFAPDAESPLPADYRMTGEIVYQFAGMTRIRERPHLVVNIAGKLQGKSKSHHINMNGDVGGYMLIDIETGQPSVWEDSSFIRVVMPASKFTIREENKGEMSKL